MQKKYVRKKPFYEKIADLCEVPADMILEVPVIVIRGKHEVEVNGCDGILKYDMGECVLSVGKDTYTVNGDHLDFSDFRENVLYVRGNIDSVYLVSENKKTDVPGKEIK